MSGEIMQRLSIYGDLVKKYGYVKPEPPAERRVISHARDLETVIRAWRAGELRKDQLVMNLIELGCGQGTIESITRVDNRYCRDCGLFNGSHCESCMAG